MPLPVMCAALRVVVSLLALFLAFSGYAEPIIQQETSGNRLTWMAVSAAEPFGSDAFELSGASLEEHAASFDFPSLAPGSSAAFLVPAAFSLRHQFFVEPSEPLIRIPDESVGALFLFSVLGGVLVRAFSRRHRLAVR